MPTTKKKSQKKSKRKPIIRWFGWICLFLLLFLVGFFLDYLLFPRYIYPTGPSRNIGENGLWLNWRWYFGRYSPADETAMEQRLRMAGVRSAYFHVLSVDDEGLLKYHHAETARTLTKSVHRSLPHTTLYAWVYVGNRDGRGSVDLSDPSTRANLVKEAVWLTKTCGFDGVQWDYEICPSNDVSFLELLRSTRAAIGTKKKISVASALRLPSAVAGRWGWSDAYFGQVSRLCNQICVMGYDSCMVTPRTYVALMRSETIWVTGDVDRANPKCRVLIGIPSYGDRTAAHNPYAENLRFALIGVRDGAASHKARPQVLDGVAVFADYTTDYGQWLTYQGLWPRTVT